MKFITVDFQSDLIAEIIAEIADRTILVFPTRLSVSVARHRFQPFWRFQDIKWTTMQDFKDELLQTGVPEVQDDKRVLCLYQVLSEEDKEYFHIYGFDDAVAWGGHFFRFFTELVEAEKTPEILASMVAEELFPLRQWQKSHCDRILQILQRYREYLNQLGYCDRIFSNGVGDATIPYRDYKIILANQYYYTPLEKALIEVCEQAGNEVMVFYHGVQVLEKEWSTEPLDLETAWKALLVKPSLKIITCENEQQSALALLNLEDASAGLSIVDGEFLARDYSQYFSEDIVRLPKAIPICNSRWFKYLYAILEIVQSQDQTPGYIPLRLLIKHFSTLEMVQILFPDMDIEIYDKLMGEVFQLSSNEFLYLDLQPSSQFSLQTEDFGLPVFIFKLFGVCHKVLNISTMADLMLLLEEELSCQISATSQELQYTNILELVWAKAANFCAAERLGFVTDWKTIFPHVPSGLLKLWLDYVKNENLRYSKDQEKPSPWEITNLLDSRNLSPSRVAFLNMVEGKLPQAPESVWLFSEGQRRHLGLKTYEDIRDWERYYWFRLVFCATEVSIYTYQKMEKNTEPSSFIGELCQFAEFEQLHLEVSATSLFTAWQQKQMLPWQAHLKDQECFSQKIEADFFVLPADPAHDFGANRRIKTTSYGLSLFTKNPFVWYITSLRNIQAKKAELLESISPSLFGSLLHDYFADVLLEHKGKHASLDTLNGVFSDRGRLKQSLLTLISAPKYRYKIPKNYNAEFLGSIICDCLADSLYDFYNRFLKRQLYGKTYDLIPEEEMMTDAERIFKPLLEMNIDDEIYQICIRGKADLRIETLDTKYIIDFKTGSASAEQLIFYEWVYYLLENPDLSDTVKSMIWLILDSRIDSKVKTSDKARSEYRMRIMDSLQQCIYQGYGLSKKAADRISLKNISRSDLYNPGVQDETL